MQYQWLFAKLCCNIQRSRTEVYERTLHSSSDHCDLGKFKVRFKAKALQMDVHQAELHEWDLPMANSLSV